MKKMKESKRSGYVAALITSTLILGAVSASAADSGNITVQGTVAPVNEITVTSQTGFDTLDLTNGGTDVLVAVVNEKNNDPDGYKVTLVSLNAGTTAQANLKGADTENASVINYSIKYGAPTLETAVTLVSGSAEVTSTTAATPEAGTTKNLKISFAGSSWSNADTYSDTLTLTIAAK